MRNPFAFGKMVCKRFRTLRMSAERIRRQLLEVREFWELFVRDLYANPAQFEELPETPQSPGPFLRAIAL